MVAICFQNSRSLSPREYTGSPRSFSLLGGAKEQGAASIEDRGRAGDAGADAGLEVAAHTGLRGGGAAVGLEAVEVEPEALGALPEVRIVDVASVLVERIDQLEEAALQAGGLGGGMQGG